MTYPIPKNAFDDRLAIVGTAGSGKTYLTLGAVEYLLARNSRVIFVDPLGVAWGLRLHSDGKSASPFQPVIFGGSHGDLPINERSGAIVGQAVATSSESCIIDLSLIGTKAAERRFMLAFLTALYRDTNKEPVHLIIDEADMFAPQKLLDKEGDAAKLLGMMETVVRRGRVKGFVPWLLTQRPAVLSKDVISQADGVVALKLTAEQDRRALGGWVESTADTARWKAIDAALPTFQRGHGVLWIPARGILADVSFPANTTFDSSRTPKRGERARTTTLKPIDLGALKERLASVEAEAKANDPVALKAEIGKLKAEIGKLSSAKASAPVGKINTADLKAARAEGREAGVIEGRAAAVKALGKFARDLSNSIKGAKEATDRAHSLMDSYADFIEALAKDIPQPPKSDANYSPNYSKPIPPGSFAPSVGLPRSLLAPPKGKAAPTANGADGALTGPQRTILGAMAWWKALGHPEVTRAQVAAKAGFKVSGGHFLNRLSELARGGYIAFPRANYVDLTPGGEAAAPNPDIDLSVADSIRAALTGPQAKLFDALLEEPEMSREALAAAAGFEPNGGHFLNRLSELGRMEIITFPQRGQVLLQGWITP